MRNLRRALIIGALFYACQPAAEPCPADRIDESARVDRVYDGDTLRLVDGRKVRLIGIDTPEMGRKDRAEQPLASDARSALIRLIETSDNRVNLRFGTERVDRYQRTLAHLYLPDGRNVQSWLITQGLAKAFTTPPNSRLSECYSQLEQAAMEKQLGIWALADYQPKTLDGLSPDDNGFRRIHGRITDHHVDKKGEWLIVDQKIRLRIRTQDRGYFNHASLHDLVGRAVEVRGWLHPRKSHFFMSLRHPSALILK